MLKILVTGASGFVGSELVKYLALQGHDVYGVVRTSSCKNKSEKFIKTSISDLKVEFLEQFDAVIHLAGIAHTRLKNSDLNYRFVNTELSVELANKSVDAGCKKFIFLSTAKVHGQQSIQSIHSDSPINPQDPYSESKAKAEDYMHCIVSDTQFISIRPPVVYGPNPKGNIQLMQQLSMKFPVLVLPRANNRRSFISLSNLCGAINAGLINGLGVVSRGYVISDGGSTSSAELFELMCLAAGTSARILRIHSPFYRSVDSLIEKMKGQSVFGPLYEDFEIRCSQYNEAFNWRPSCKMEDQLKLMYVFNASNTK